MKIQKQTNRWSCLLTSTAMVLDIPQADIISELGHDGSEIVWPEYPEPYCRRSFHIQEMIDIAIKYGYSVTPIDTHPISAVSPIFRIKQINRLVESVIESEWKDKVTLYQIQAEVNNLLTDGYEIKVSSDRLKNYLKNNCGLLIGETPNGKPHAAAWSNVKGKVFDPNGLIYDIGSFCIETFYIFTKE